MGARLRIGSARLLASWRCWVRRMAAAVAVIAIAVQTTRTGHRLGCGTLTVAIAIAIAWTRLTSGTALLLPALGRGTGRFRRIRAR
jgi:hypothetical protein